MGWTAALLVCLQMTSNVGLCQNVLKDWTAVQAEQVCWTNTSVNVVLWNGQSPALGQAGASLLATALKKSPRDPGRMQVVQEAEVYPCRKTLQQQGEGILHRSSAAVRPLLVRCPGLAAENKCWHTGGSPVEGPCGGWNTGHMEEVEFSELIQPCEEEGEGRPGCGYSLVGRYKFCSGTYSNRFRGNRHALECGKSPLGMRKNFCNMVMLTTSEQSTG